MIAAQPKSGNIAGCINECIEVNEKEIYTRYSQGWVDEVFTDLEALVQRVRKAKNDKEVVSIAYFGNVIDVWETFYASDIQVE
jgi:urocanate hydratase